MQSFTRQLKRGNAMVVFDNVFKRYERISKRGTDRRYWNKSRAFRDATVENEMIENGLNPQVGFVGRKAGWFSPTRKRRTKKVEIL